MGWIIKQHWYTPLLRCKRWACTLIRISWRLSNLGWLLLYNVQNCILSNTLFFKFKFFKFKLLLNSPNFTTCLRLPCLWHHNRLVKWGDLWCTSVDDFYLKRLSTPALWLGYGLVNTSTQNSGMQLLICVHPCAKVMALFLICENYQTLTFSNFLKIWVFQIEVLVSIYVKFHWNRP